MTTRLVADSEHMDHVTILLARVCAARLDTTIAAEDFVRMVARLVDVAVAEAIEDHDATPRLRVNDEQRACPHCGDIVATMVGHACERMRELGFVDAAKPPRWRDDSSTGAAAVVTGAQPPSTETAARETPAAPSKPAEVVVDNNLTRGEQRPLAELDSTRDATLAKPAPSQPEAPLSGSPADGAGTSPAGPLAGAEASHRRGRGNKALTDEQITSLRAEFAAAGKPYGWITKKADKLGIGTSTLHRALNGEAPPKREPVPDYVAGEDLAHTETPQCWCRKRPPSREHVWCKLRTVQKPASQHAALRAPEPRVRRIVGTRY